jgi:signal transduction histidine kinase
MSDLSMPSLSFSKRVPPPLPAKGRDQSRSHLEDILISGELRSRPRRAPNLEGESEALRILARVMANSPRQLPDTLLRLALELCRAGSAGISLVETPPDAAPVLRWTNLAGVLKDHVGGFAPRNSSPCGVSLDRKSPQLFSYPARHFPYLNEFAAPVVEALVIPLTGAGPAGTIWFFTHQEGIVFDSEDVRMMTDLADFASSALRAIQLLDVDRSARDDAATEVAKQTAELKAQVAERKRAEESLGDLTARLLQLRDEEQRRVARELHDSVGQLLVAMSMNHRKLSLEKQLSPVAAKAISENTTLLAQVSTEIRTISHLLHPPLLDEVGLAPGMREYLEGFADRSRMKVRFEIAEDFGRLSREIETALFRIVQESLTNVHRHSESESVTIRIMRSSDAVSVTIADTGRGIPKQEIFEIEAGRASGVGLRGMRERVRQLGGRFKIRSTDRGTVVVARLPLDTTSDLPNDFVAPSFIVTSSSLLNPEAWGKNQLLRPGANR